MKRSTEPNEILRYEMPIDRIKHPVPNLGALLIYIIK